MTNILNLFLSNEDKFIISFTDITDEEQLVNINTKTGFGPLDKVLPI